MGGPRSTEQNPSVDIVDENGRYHVAVFESDSITKVLRGDKIQGLWCSQLRRAPFGAVDEGDTIYVRQNSGPIVAIAKAGRVRYFANLDSEKVERLRLQFNYYIHADRSHWAELRDANYATIIDLAGAETIEPKELGSGDSAEWLVVNEKQTPRCQSTPG